MLQKNSEIAKAEYTIYSELLNDYQELVKSKNYLMLESQFIFDFLNAKYSYDILKSFSENPSVKFSFENGSIANYFISNILKTKHNTEKLLEAANSIIEKNKLEEKINYHVRESSSLPVNCLIKSNSFLTKIAKECTEIFPEYASLLTLSFKNHFVRSCLSCLNIEELTKVFDMKYITKQDIMNNLNVEEQNNIYIQNILYAKKIFNIESEKEIFTTKIKGVSYENRQVLLEELKQQTEKQTLTALPGTFTPPDKPTEPCVEIIWNKNTLGFLPKAVILDIQKRYTDPEYKILNYTVIGGGIKENTGEKINYGCEIEVELEIKDLKKNKIEEENIEK